MNDKSKKKRHIKPVPSEPLLGNKTSNMTDRSIGITSRYMEKQIKHISKLLSLVLRHEPLHIGLTLNENGWANVEDFIRKVNNKGIALDFETLQMVVETNDKKRFTFNENKTLIRANQGHSIEVELNLKEQPPPEFLYHGTVQKFLNAIKKEGLQKMRRQHVHLSKDIETSMKVGSRRGLPVILIVQSGEMNKDGYTFYLSDNDVWLTDQVPVKYIQIPE
jgi:putative RNA 2'-phosphotransferase